MNIVTVGKSIKDHIGSTSGIATLYKDKQYIGRCLDTPNAIACAMKHSGATRVLNMFGEIVNTSPTRLAAGGWMTLRNCGFVAAPKETS